ncbi:MAG: CsgG/HfaB family protein, partial [Spirochaetota bacterium]
MIQRLLIFTLLAAVLCAAEKKPRVAVLAFTAKGVSQMESEAVTELFASALVSSRAFDVLDRANMENILREQQFQQTGCTETACAVKIGKVLNVEYMIYGAVMNIGDKYFVSANMVNIETSKIEKSGQESTDNFKQVNEALRRLIEKLTGIMMEEGDKGTKIKYFGRVTSVSGNEVTINAGSEDGARLNEEY